MRASAAAKYEKRWSIRATVLTGILAQDRLYEGLPVAAYTPHSLKVSCLSWRLVQHLARALQRISVAADMLAHPPNARKAIAGGWHGASPTEAIGGTTVLRNVNQERPVHLLGGDQTSRGFRKNIFSGSPVRGL